MECRRKVGFQVERPLGRGLRLVPGVKHYPAGEDALARRERVAWQSVAHFAHGVVAAVRILREQPVLFVRFGVASVQVAGVEIRVFNSGAAVRVRCRFNFRNCSKANSPGATTSGSRSAAATRARPRCGRPARLIRRGTREERIALGPSASLAPAAGRSFLLSRMWVGEFRAP